MINKKNLRKLRLDKGWTQGHAAREIGIQQSYLSKLENDQASPSLEILKKISTVYGCQITEIAHAHQAQIVTSTLSSESNNFDLLFVVFGTLLIALAFFGIIRNNTAYTYELVSLEHSHVTAPNFIVTDEFMGEKYIASEENLKSTYKLLGERSISPPLNRIFYFFGVVFLLVGLALLSVRLVKLRSL